MPNKGKQRPRGTALPDPDAGYLQIGGVVISQGPMPSRSQQRQAGRALRGQAPAQGPAAGSSRAHGGGDSDAGGGTPSGATSSSELDEELLDYLANAEGQEAGSSSGSGGDDAALLATMRLFGASAIDERPASTGASSDDSGSDGAAGGQPLTEQEAARLLAEDPTGVLLVDRQGRPVGAMEQLAPGQRYPVLARQRPEAGGVADSSMGAERPRQRSLAKGAKVGKLRPGEKAELRKEAIKARRAAREAWRGFDVEATEAALRAFVAEGGDMLALEPCGKQGLEVTRRLAAMFHLKHSVQGKGSSRRVVVTVGPGTCLPDSPAAEEKLAALVAGCRRLQQLGAAQGAGVGPAGMAADRRRDARSRQPRAQVGSGASRPDGSSVLQQPVLFVPSGVLDPSSGRLERLPPTGDQAAGAGGEQEAGPAQHLAAACVSGAPAAEASGGDHSSGEGDAGGAGSRQRPAAAAHATASFVRGLMGGDGSGSEAGDDGAGPREGTDQPSAAMALRRRSSTPASSASQSDGSGSGQSDREQQEADGEEQQLLGAGSYMGLGFAGGAAGAGLGSWLVAGSGSAAQMGPAAHAVPPLAAIPQPRYPAPAFSLGLGCAPASGGAQEAGELSPPRLGLGGLGLGSLPPHAPPPCDSAAGLGSSADEVLPAPAGVQQGLGQPRLPQPAPARQGPARGSTRGTSLLAQQAGADGPPSQLTKQRAKAAAKKQAKLERRRGRQGDDAPAGGGGAPAHAGPGSGRQQEAGAAPVEADVVGAEYAHFERHTNGIGSRLMQQMGWVAGEGLGRARQGRSMPLQATQRPRQRGLGA